MLERTVDIETADGTMPVFVTCPESGGPFAPVVLFMDIWGFRELLCDIARRIGTVGYAAARDWERAFAMYRRVLA